MQFLFLCACFLVWAGWWVLVCFVLLQVLGAWTPNVWRLWPVLLIAVGVAVLAAGTRRFGEERESPEEPPQDGWR